MRKIYIIPVGNIIDPQTGMPVPEKGTFVELNTYWQRRIDDKDVIVRDKKQKTEKPDKETK